MMDIVFCAIGGAYFVTTSFFSIVYLREKKLVPIITPILGALVGGVMAVITRH